MFHSYLLVLLIVVIGAGIFLHLLVRFRPAFQQKPTEICVREPGERFLGPPAPLQDEAKLDLDFALLSQAAYQRKPRAKQVRSGECVDADHILAKRGWERWKDFPSEPLQQKFEAMHLRVEVWSNAGTKSIAVAFGGTVFDDWRDWLSNLRWFIPFRKDEYTEVVTDLAPAFVTAYKQALINRPALHGAELYSTGHSLGGGLAHEFAYSLPIADAIRPKKVYAFDPSPVTGYFSVDRKTREENARNLAIHRIYERKEVLAILRSMMSIIAPPSASSPAIRQVRYNLFPTSNAITGHSIQTLALKLYQAAGSPEVQSKGAP